MGGLSGKGLKAAILGGLMESVCLLSCEEADTEKDMLGDLKMREGYFLQSKNNEERHVAVSGLCSLLDRKFFDGVI